jgi:hypothetical protein
MAMSWPSSSGKRGGVPESPDEERRSVQVEMPYRTLDFGRGDGFGTVRRLAGS